MEKYTVTEIMNFDDNEEWAAKQEFSLNIGRLMHNFLGQEGALHKLQSDPEYIKLSDERDFLDAVIILKTLGAIYHNDATGEWVIKEELTND